MSDAPTRIGAYEVVREIGRGGMGVVFLARDTKLDRDVAIKTLPPTLTDDPHRLARFEREGKALAQLNHANIAGIYGVEEQEGQKFLVLEYVEGHTLGDRLGAGPIPLDEALEIAVAIVAGLEAAHRVGVVHRDLKPDNIRITPQGDVKVLDFGLAKADPVGEGASGTHSPTVTSWRSPTIPGTILGTAAYMSPEQARGRAVDKRTDIWSFGVVLYQMLTGANPFSGETIHDSVGATLHKDPDWTVLPADTPTPVRRLLRRCLTKDVKHRLHDIADARLELEEAIAGTGSDLEPAVAVGLSRRSSILMIVVALAAFSLGLLATKLWLGQPTGSASTVAFEIDVSEIGEVTLPAGSADIAISRDGRRIAFEYQAGGDQGIAARELATNELRVIDAARGGYGPFFSPDGRWLGFGRDGKLMKAALEGGPAITIAEIRNTRNRVAWLDTDQIVFSDGGRAIRVVSADGGAPTTIATADGFELSDGRSQLFGFVEQVWALPDGRGVLTGAGDGNSIEDFDIVHVALDTGKVTQVIERGTQPTVLDDEYVVFLRDSSLLAVRFDFDRLQPLGNPQVVLEGVRTGPWGDVAQYELGTDGTLAYVPGRRLVEDRRLIRVTRTGDVEPVTGTDALAGYLAASSDGKTIAMVTHRRSEELWLYELDSGAMKPVSIGEEGARVEPVLSPDGTQIVYREWAEATSGSRVVVRSVDVMEEPRFVAGGNMEPSSWSRDGLLLLTSNRGVILVKDMASSDDPLPLDESQTGRNPRFSPDGRWIAFYSGESGMVQVYVCRFPYDRRKWQVSIDGGYRPHWSPDGDEIFFVHGGQMHAARFGVSASGEPRIGAIETLFDASEFSSQMWGGVFDVLPNGDFIMIERAPWERPDARIHVILNWGEVVRQRLGSS